MSEQLTASRSRLTDRGTEFLPISLSQNLTEWPLSTAVNIMYPFPLPESFYDQVEKYYPRDGTGWWVGRETGVHQF